MTQGSKVHTHIIILFGFRSDNFAVKDGYHPKKMDHLKKAANQEEAKEMTPPNFVSNDMLFFENMRPK